MRLLKCGTCLDYTVPIISAVVIKNPQRELKLIFMKMNLPNYKMSVIVYVKKKMELRLLVEIAWKLYGQRIMLLNTGHQENIRQIQIPDALIIK